MIDRVSFFNGNTREAAAIPERIIADARHTFRNCDARKATATVERPRADARHAIRNRDTREATATIERIIANARHAVGNRDAREATAKPKRIIADARHAGFDNNRLNIILISVPRHCIIIKIRHLPRSADRQHARFGIERPREVMSLCAAGAVIGFGRRGQNEKCRQRGGYDGDGQAYKQ